jgi:hypothetical protein
MNSSVIEHGGILDQVFDGYCVWRFNDEDKLLLTSALLENVVELSNYQDGSNEKKGITILSGYFLISDEEKGEMVVINSRDISERFEIDFGSALHCAKEVFSSPGQIYMTTACGLLRLDLEARRLDLVYIIDVGPAFFSYFDGSMVYADMINGKLIERRALGGEVLWSVELGDGLPELTMFSKLVGDKVILLLDDESMLALDANTGKFLWRLEKALQKKWLFDDACRIIGTYKARLRIIDSNTGKIISEKPINADWANQSDSYLPQVFSCAVTKTHLWAGFSGRGLCAINLETGNVDYQVLDGGSCDSDPKILNNRIFVPIRSGGMGIGSGRQEYVIEGAGGYKPDSDGFFEIP